MHIIVFFQTPLGKAKNFNINLKWKPCELISCNMITNILQNISDCRDLNICGNAYVIKARKSSNAQFLFQEKHTQNE
jgi:hypothetical protein